MKSASKKTLIRLIEGNREEFAAFCRSYLKDPSAALEQLRVVPAKKAKSKTPADKAKVDEFSYPKVNSFDHHSVFKGKTESEIAELLKATFSMPELRYAVKKWRLVARGTNVDALASAMAQRIRTILV